MNIVSKEYERYSLNGLSNPIEKALSNVKAAYRKTYSWSNVLIRLIKDWEKNPSRQQKDSRVSSYESIKSNWVCSTWIACCKKALIFLYSYLKRTKQSVKTNDPESFFQILLSGVTHGSILGPILFSLFINDLLFFIKEAELTNFADKNTKYVGSKDLTELLEIFQTHSKHDSKPR